MGLKKKPIERNYDASNNVRGKDILHWDIEKIRIELNEKLTGIIGGNKYNSHKSDNEFKAVKTINQTYNQKVWELYWLLVLNSGLSDCLPVKEEP